MAALYNKTKYQKVLTVTKDKGLTHVPNEGSPAVLAGHREQAAETVVRSVGKATAKERKTVKKTGKAEHQLVTSSGVVLATTMNKEAASDLRALSKAINKAAK